MRKEIFATLLCLLAFCGMAGAETAGTATSSSRLVDRFDRGIPSWQSYPLAQDVGYDPSVYTEPGASFALVRDVVNFGEKEDEIGLIRSLHFYTSGRLTISIEYATHLAGEPVSAQLLVTTKDGHKYETKLPVHADGKESLVISGDELKLPQTGADIDAVVVLYRTRHAPLGSHSYLKVYSFSMKAADRSEPHLLSPKLIVSSTGNAPVTNGVASPGRPMRFVLDAVPREVKVFDGDGLEVTGEISIVEKTVAWTPGQNARPGLWTVKIESSEGQTSFRILLLHDAPSTSGGGVLSPARLQQLKMDKQFESLRKNIHLQAQRLAQNLTFNQADGDSIALLSPRSVHAGLEAYLSLMSNYGDAIAWNALDYRLNGDKDALETTRKALLTVSAWKTWTPTWFTAHGIRTYYVAGVFTERLSAGYNLVADALSPPEKAEIASAVLEKSIQPSVDDYYISDRMPTGSSNHMAHSVGGAIAAWVALNAASPDWGKQHTTELSELIVAYEDLLRGLFPGDGSEAEPAGYEDFAMEGMTYGIAALENMGITPKGVPAMMNSFWWLKYAQAGSSQVLDTGDTNSHLGDLYGFAWIAEHGNSPEVMQLYNPLALPVAATLPVPNLLDLVCCTQPAAHVDAPPASRVFDLRGSSALRSGWSDADTVLSLRAGPWFNHEHHDQGSFQIASGGLTLVGEGGYADYYRDPSYNDYFTQAPAHNTVLIDHDPFSQKSYDGRYWKALANFPKIETSLLGVGIDYLDTNLQPAYGDALTSFHRKFIFVKPDLVIVEDSLQSTVPHTFTWQLHAGGAVVPQQNGAVKLYDASGSASATLLAETPEAAWKITQTPNAVQQFTNIEKSPVEKRTMVSIDSKPGSTARFIEAIGINDHSSSLERLKGDAGEGFIRHAAEEESLALLRKAPGKLDTHGCSTDGDILALTQRGSEELHVFASNSHVFTIGSQFHLVSSRSGNFDFDQAKGKAVITVQLGADGDITITGPAIQGAIAVDGLTMEVPAGGKLHLHAGKHVISFAVNSHLINQ